MAHKGQKQEGVSCGEVFAVCMISTHTGIAPYPYIWQHSASCATHCMARSELVPAVALAWSVAIAMPPALSCK